jgi:hypothetical protein
MDSMDPSLLRRLRLAHCHPDAGDLQENSDGKAQS